MSSENYLNWLLFLLQPVFRGGKGGEGGPDHEWRPYFRSNHESRLFFWNISRITYLTYTIAKKYP